MAKEKQEVSPARAAAILETHGLVTLLSALDAMVKTSDVELESVFKIGGGFLVMGISGHIAEVKAAIQVALDTTRDDGGVIFAEVYSRPHERTTEVLRDPLSEAAE